MRTPLSPFLSLLFPTTALALYPNPYLNPTGSITLCTDSNCQQNAYANAWVLGGDFCSPLSLSPPLNSYLITQRPTCDNGSYADWATYSDKSCEKEKERVPYNNDDVCESFSGVEAVAFICEGFHAKGGDGRGDGGAGSSMPVITATYSETPISTVTKPAPSNSLGTTITAAVTSTSVPAFESTASARVSSSTGAPPNGTSTSATLSAPSALRTGGASSLASCSGFVFLLLPVCFLFVGL